MKKVTRAELNRLFDDGKWDEQLKSCTKVPYYDKPTPSQKLYALGTHTVGYKFIDSQGLYVALVFYYQHPNGQMSKPSPKLLLINGVWHFT